MIKLYDNGVYLVNGNEIIEDDNQAAAKLNAEVGNAVSKEDAAKNTMAYNILKEHNTSGNMEKLQIKFDKMTSHDITFVGIMFLLIRLLFISLQERCLQAVVR